MISAKVILAFLLQTINISADVPHENLPLDQQEVFCLAQAVYYEAKSEDIQGQYAVAYATLNRTVNPQYPSSVCGVVQQTSKSSTTNSRVCSFSWFCDKSVKHDDISFLNKNGSVDDKTATQFETASKVAINVLAAGPRSAHDITRGATHFFNPSVSDPSWRYRMTKTLSHGNHVFYR